MIELAVAAYLLAAQNTPPASSGKEDVWLDCSWQEVWKSSGSLGRASSESATEHQYDSTYVLSKSLNRLFLYQPESKTLYEQQAEIVPTAIVIDDQQHDESMLGESKSRRLWSVSRQDLKVKLFGTSERNVRLDDGRIASTSITMDGDGACVLSAPKPIAPLLPNKF
jgi:hypothetical protein